MDGYNAFYEFLQKPSTLNMKQRHFSLCILYAFIQRFLSWMANKDPRVVGYERQATRTESTVPIVSCPSCIPIAFSIQLQKKQSHSIHHFPSHSGVAQDADEASCRTKAQCVAPVEGSARDREDQKTAWMLSYG